jgi:site-specific DNA-methyltransferase (adenine-specific)
MDAQSGVLKSGVFAPHHADNGKTAGTYGAMTGRDRAASTYGDQGGASRFFPIFRYEAKAPASERPRGEDGTAHATVKPLALMRWLVRLVTPPGGVVLDPFLGSGTTAEACVIEGFRCIGIERDETHLPLIKARLAKPIQPTLGFESAS